MNEDSLGDRMKQYESLYESHFMPQLPILCRVDGRSFHSFTKGLDKPFDLNLIDLMRHTCKFLVGETNANVGYVQSDEISLMWNYTDKAQPLFGSRVQKLASIMSSLATAYFNKFLFDFLPKKQLSTPVFDGRVWNVPSKTEVVNYFIWRERDAVRNSISMAAQSMFSHNELQEKSSSEMQEMMFQKGNNWNDYIDCCKRGSYVKRTNVVTPFSADEIEKLPPLHEARKNPNLIIERSVIDFVPGKDTESLTFESRYNLIFGE